MGEFSFIDAIKQHTYKQSSVITGIGDDAAVFRQSFRDIVTAVDTFVEDVHFSPYTTAPFHIGYRGLAANISDLAAMGATPAFYLVSIVVPQNWSVKSLGEIYAGMANLAASYQLDLIGGDTTAGKEMTISVTVIGYADRGKARLRSQAQAGDIVFVTGTLGDAQAGFHILTNPDQDYIDKEYYVRRHQMPEPRVAFAQMLKDLPRLALNDISDGIANEASEIATASGVVIDLHAEQLPTAASLTQFPACLQQKWKLFGGEDFELLGTVPEENWQFVRKMAKQTETPLSKIGYVRYTESEAGLVYLYENNKKQRLDKKGYDHMK